MAGAHKLPPSTIPGKGGARDGRSGKGWAFGPLKWWLQHLQKGLKGLGKDGSRPGGKEDSLAPGRRDKKVIGDGA